jgi:SAM-dependent methyltransferase
MDGVHESSGFEYRTKESSRKTLFETFLAHTDEKEQSAVVLSGILESQVVNGALRILDVGAGTGEYLELALTKLPQPLSVDLRLVEPSTSLTERLQQTFGAAVKADHAKISSTDFDSFSTDDRFDVVIASHVMYHFPLESWPRQLQKMLSFLKPTGALVIVIREKDDVYEFKNAFRPRLDEDTYAATYTGDVQAAFQSLEPSLPVRIERLSSTSHLVLPADADDPDLHAIIEFYLHVPWKDIPLSMRREITVFLQKRNWSLKQVDGYIVARR